MHDQQTYVEFTYTRLFKSTNEYMVEFIFEVKKSFFLSYFAFNTHEELFVTFRHSSYRFSACFYVIFTRNLCEIETALENKWSFDGVKNLSRLLWTCKTYVDNYVKVNKNILMPRKIAMQWKAGILFVNVSFVNTKSIFNTGYRWSIKLEIIRFMLPQSKIFC